jgi:HrpA-like RNA helicase
MTEPEKKQTEQLKKQRDVKEALEQATRRAGRTKTGLIVKLLDRLNKEPERVGFPKRNLR